MPIYEYLCTACDHRLDAIQKLADAPLKTCPRCGQDALQKQLSAPSFRLSGSGWYETDFKSDKEKRRNLAKAEDGGGSVTTRTTADTTDKPKSASTSASTAKAD